LGSPITNEIYPIKADGNARLKMVNKFAEELDAVSDFYGIFFNEADVGKRLENCTPIMSD
jgi:hypothetical protein